MKKAKYSYLVVPIGENGEVAYKAVIPKFPKILVMSETVKNLDELVADEIENAIKEIKKKGETAPSPDIDSIFSGKILLRLSPDLHEKLFFEAQSNRLSLNKYIRQKLSSG